MHAEEKLVKEYWFTNEPFPGVIFKVRADAHEKAVRKLISDLRAAIAEMQKHKGQTIKNQNQPTA
jgi:hypothetical protein